MWLEWPDYNASLGRLVMEVRETVPTAVVRFDFIGEGWGCSITADGTLPDGRWEVYGEGVGPRSAIEAAIEALTSPPDSGPPIGASE